MAEGVETVAAWRELAELDCDLARGYLLSRPCPAEDVPALVGAERALGAR